MKRLPLLTLVAVLALLVFCAPSSTRVGAQARLVSPPSQENEHVALGLAIRRLGVVGTFLQTAAHPDDEHNQLHALLALGQGLRSIDLQTTRGDGGQNEIGPELFQDMAVLRTAELLSAHRFDGAEQWFTRAIDFGYSFSPPEIYEKWGRAEVTGDFVRFIREFRPDVVLTMNIQGRGGDRAHEATAVLTRDAFRAAADPSQFPEQIKAGLRPWQAQKLYFTGGFGMGPGGPGGGRGGAAPAATPSAEATATINTNVYDPLLGRTYSEIGSEARSNHKCQGMGQMVPIPGIGGGRGGPGGRYQLVDTTLPREANKDESSLFDGIDTSLGSLARFAGANPPEALKAALAAIAEQAARAQKTFDARDDAATAAPIEQGLVALRGLRGQLGSMGLSDAARFEIDFRLKTKEQDWENAVIAAHELTFEALADDGLVVAGQPVRLNLIVVNRGSGEVSVADASVTGFDGKAACKPATLRTDGVFACAAEVKIPQSARLTAPYWTDEYWNRRPPKLALDIFEPDAPFGAPFRPTPFRATFRIKAGAVEISRDLGVQYRYNKDIFVGEKRMELNVVPAFSVKVSPTTAVVPLPARGAGGAAKPVERQVYVSVTNGTKGPAQGKVTLDLPAGWKVVPAAAPVSFMNEDEALTVRFAVTIPPSVAQGEYKLRAVVTSASPGAQPFAEGYQEIEYPHIERRQEIKPAEAAFKVMDVKVAPNIRLGYIVGAGDQVPAALEQLGAKVDYIEPDELAWGDLSRYDVIMTGTRAYAKRPDLRAYNRRLIDFAERGGTVIVQYNKMEFNQAQFGPYPAKVGNGRVTDENAPVKTLVPGHPVFNFPNKIGDRAWQGWVQERGLYFLGEKDPRYVDLISMEDPFPDNAGVKLGSLVEARVGKGRWLYVGLGLWRQVPAETDGAFLLLANLISLPKAPAAAPTAQSGAPR